MLFLSLINKIDIDLKSDKNVDYLFMIQLG